MSFKDMSVLHILGGQDRQGGMMNAVLELASNTSPGLRQYIWKHRDFQATAQKDLFVCLGRAKRTDLGLWRDLIGAAQELIPLFRWIQQNPPLVLHAHSRMGILAALALKLIIRCPLVIHLHSLAGRPWLYRWAWKMSGAIPVFNSVKTCRHFGCRPEESAVILPTLVWPEQPLAIESTGIRFIAAGAFVRMKKFVEIINAFAQLVKQDKRLELIIFGVSDEPLDPDYQNEVVALVKKNPAITLKNYDPEWTKQLRTSDVFIHAADRESFGIVILQAFAQGCGCVVPRETFLDELTEPCRSTGIYRMIPGSPENIREQMQVAMEHPASGAELWNMRRKVSPLFSVEKAVLKLSRIYTSALQ